MMGTHLNAEGIIKGDGARRTAGLVVVILFAALVCIPWLERPFHTRGEPREALVAQAMIATGNWISPPAYDGAVPSKPPFSHWFISLFSLPIGEVNEATSRLPSALAFIIFVAGFFVFLARRIGSSSALGASLILLTTSEWFRAASTCRVDTILATSMAGALASLFSWWERGYRGIPLLAIALTTSATLTKGPVGFVLPIGIFSFFCWSRSGFRVAPLFGIAGRSLLIVIPVIGVTGIWYILGYLQRGDDFIEKVLYENVQRFAGTMADEPHKHSVAYLLGVLALGVLPWTIPLVWGWSGILPRWGAITRFEFLSRRGYQEWWNSLSAFYQFCWISVTAIVVFFCIPSSKRSVYLLPAYPFLVVLLEQFLSPTSGSMTRLLGGVAKLVYAIVALVLLASVVLYVIPIGDIHLSYAALLRSFTTVKVVSLGVVVALLYCLRGRLLGEIAKTAVGKLAISIICAVTAISCFLYDTIAWQLSPKSWVNTPEFNAAVRPELRSKMYSYGSESYGASFYLGKPFSRVAPGSVQEGMVVFLEAKRLEEFKPSITPNIRELFRYRSGVESTKKDIVVIELTSPQIQSASS